ncbi:hypothetical protein CLV62_101281 [Dysgonomonas alginatilytica]|uniref:Lipoprotein n=1 Tax=Dysgonomonas alginatilytica TaxID=1605892 RepID=A0A2V3PW40_9BACT|nr:hypothetical protein [Dysgonomonas alginatilytica]PXV69014.1 hypothetical protein CLV62_101281 [Dysgonomonas alginatilytica]
MKIKTVLIAISVIGFLSFLFTSCSQEGEMGVGETVGENTPDGNAPSKVIVDSIPFSKDNTITNSNFPNKQ